MTLFRRKKTLTINEPDPEYNVVYLGNVLTVLAKGDGCVDKPLSLIWRAYNARLRPDLTMKLRVTKSGLRASTKSEQKSQQSPSTDYWAHRITYCTASVEYPRLFAWIYKHEGAKPMKPELRCHAVLCKKVEQAQALSVSLAEKLSTALQDYRRDKLSRQNTRLSGRLAVMPLRKQMLNTAANNFRPPLNRCRSAPRLDSIDENEEIFDEITNRASPTTDSVGHRRHFALRLSIGAAEDARLMEDDESDDILVPGTPAEFEFDARKRLSTDAYRVDLDIGNDVDKLAEDIAVRKYLCREETDDSISDESGYGEEKASSLEDYDPNDVLDDDDEAANQITSL